MATAQFFLEQYAPMFHTGDTRVWEALSAPECTYCADALENAERVRDEGWTATGGEIVVNEAQTQGALTSELEASVLLDTQLEAAFVAGSDGVATPTGDPGDVTYGLRLELIGGHWKITGVASEDS
jgi:hypothetical protein